MKFAHIGDCHLGGWRVPELRDLNFQSFQMAIDKMIKEKVEFTIITGDFFDSPYPPIETLKDAFSELRKLKDNNIPVFYITGSHDYSASGKTFLEVLEKAGFCTSVMNFEENKGNLVLLPTIFKNVALYGYPGKKSSLEVEEIEKLKIQDAPGMFKILMLHTALRDALGTLPIKAVDHRLLPKFDYLALSHLHIDYCKEGRVYSGPTFPNSLSELEDLKAGSFYIFNNGKITKEELRPKEVLVVEITLKESLSATEKIISVLNERNLTDKVLIIKLSGVLEKGKITDIDFSKIENFAKEKGAFTCIKSTSKLITVESEIKLELTESINLEDQIIAGFKEQHPSKFNDHISTLINVLKIEKLEDEKMSSFEDRINSESKKVFKL